MITREEAIGIARARAAENGWGIVEPIDVRERQSWSGEIRSFEIRSNPAKHGTKVRFTIDSSSGRVIDEGYLPR